MNRLHWEFHTRLSRKWWQIGKTLQLSTLRKSHMAFRLAGFHLTLSHSKSQGQGHAHYDSECLSNG